VLLLAGAPGLACPFFMFGQLCVALLEAVVDVVVDDGVEWLVVALATAMLPPNPTPSAPAPTAVPIMILPSLDLNVIASSRSGEGPGARTPALALAELR